MKTTMISVNVYEPGDVIMLNVDDINLVAKRRNMESGTRAMIVGVVQRLDKMYTYRILTDSGKMMALTPGEQGHEQYIGHVDLEMLFGKTSA